jgi:hypothetical protein
MERIADNGLKSRIPGLRSVGGVARNKSSRRQSIATRAPYRCVMRRRRLLKLTTTVHLQPKGGVQVFDDDRTASKRGNLTVTFGDPDKNHTTYEISRGAATLVVEAQ